MDATQDFMTVAKSTNGDISDASSNNINNFIRINSHGLGDTI